MEQVVWALYAAAFSGLFSRFTTLLLAVTPSRTQLAHFLQAPEDQDLNFKTLEVHKKRQVRGTILLNYFFFLICFELQLTKVEGLVYSTI